MNSYFFLLCIIFASLGYGLLDDSYCSPVKCKNPDHQIDNRTLPCPICAIKIDSKVTCPELDCKPGCKIDHSEKPCPACKCNGRLMSHTVYSHACCSLPNQPHVAKCKKEPCPRCGCYIYSPPAEPGTPADFNAN